MEPISALSSVITVVGTVRVATKVVQRLKKLKDAPDDLKDLLEDVSRFKAVVEGVENISADQPTPHFQEVLERANAKLLDIEKLIQYDLTEAGESDKVDRWQWTKRKTEIAEMRVQLGKIQNDLTTMAVITNLESTRTSTIDAKQNHLEHQRAIMNLADAMANQRAMLEAQQTMLGALFRIEDSPLTQKAIADQFGDDFRSAYVKPDPSLSSTGVVTQREANSNLPMRPTYSSFMRRTRLVDACSSDCVCICHMPRYAATYRVFSSVIGSGSLQIKGTAVPGRRCTVTTCRRSAATSLIISYRLPRWFAARVIYLWYTSSPLGSPEVVLRVPRVFSQQRADEVYDLLGFRFGDKSAVGDLQCHLAQGLIRPYDEFISGGSVLEVALDWHLVDAIVCFIRGGVDQYQISHDLDDWGRRSNIMEKVFVLMTGPSIGEQPILWFLDRRRSILDRLSEITPTMDFDDICEEHGFSRLHSIVCNLTKGDLNSEARAFPDLLDRVDGRGLTPLWYAALRGDSKAIRILLECGANVRGSRLPVMWAAINAIHIDGLNSECVKILIEAGACLDAPRDGCKIVDVHEILTDYLKYMARYDTSKHFSVNQLVVDSGFDFDARRCNLLLMDCVKDGSMERLNLLLDSPLKFDLEIVDEHGQKPVHQSLYWNPPQADMFSRLVNAGARLDGQTISGHTILHLAILKWTRMGHMEILVRTDLTSIDLDITDIHGLTAFELLQLRADGDRRLFLLFTVIPNDEDFQTLWEIRIADELQIIAAFRDLLYNIQEAQGIPAEARYPIITPAFSTFEEYEVLKEAWESTPTPMPGTWPEED